MLENLSTIRNFCIISHIDHGKSTLADRLLELTKTVEKRKMREQVLDQMDIERERGITIKLQPVRMDYNLNSKPYTLNLIDTPGHVDFTYEVSRSLAACEGAILLVDAAQGIQAQTLSNYYLAKEEGLAIIPVVNKIDLPNAQPDKVAKDLAKLVGADEKEVIKISAKLGTNVEKVLEAIVERIPAPKGNLEKPLQALIFDSIYDEHRGVIAFVRLFDGQIKKEEEITLLGTKRESKVLEVGIFKPELLSKDSLSAGEVGYIVTGLKEVKDCRVGDTITISNLEPQTSALPGYKPIKPMVFASFFCAEGENYPKLKEGLEKLSLNDAALGFEPESSKALGFGFRCGFLGVLHMEVVQERLEREYDLDLVITAPSVSYRVRPKTKKLELETIHSPTELPEPSQIEEIQEPWIKIEIFSPNQYLGPIMQLVEKSRGIYKTTEYLSERVALVYEMPLASLIRDFYDKLKSVSSGYASLNYQFVGYRPADLVKLDILVAGEKVEALSSIVPKEEAYREGRSLVKRLKEIIPRQLFEVALQAAIGSKIIARETISALKKDVTAKLYGGDRTRKDKLLAKQRKGKKRLKRIGKVDIPQEAFLAILKR